MSDGEVEWRSYSEWGSNRFPAGLGSSGDDPWTASSCYVAPPESRDTIESNLGRVGLTRQKAYAQFLISFHGFRESLPRLSGHFVSASDLRTVELDREAEESSWYGSLPETVMDEWSGAVPIFVACNGDELLLHPSGKAGWMMHEESTIRQEWTSFEDLIVHYADYLEYHWPFDGYGPSEKAKEARKKRGFHLS